MKSCSLAGFQGSRTSSVRATVENRLKLSFEAETPGTIVLRCEGRIVFGREVHLLSGTVANILPSAQCIVIDLSGVELVDSAGLGELVLLHLWAQAAGK